MRSGFKISPVMLTVVYAVALFCGAGKVFGQSGTQLELADLSAFRDAPASWKIVGAVNTDLDKTNTMNFVNGKGVLLNLPDKKNPGKDLYTQAEYGDIDLELDYMIAPGSNSGVYLQGRYEVQIADSWSVRQNRSGNNGGIYERWDDSKPEGQKGYAGFAPRQNVSRAPGVWQKLKISFQAPRFNAAGQKTQNAVMVRVELNGVLIHDNVELTGVTRGAMSQEEKAVGPLRIQGDHGPVAFRNIKVTPVEGARPAERGPSANAVDPILFDATENTLLRSFMDVPGSPRVVHSVSVGSPVQVHYTYDMDKGSVFQVWRGGFLNATPMWHDRGDGSSRPQGTVLRLGKPVLFIARLDNNQSAWPADTAGSSLRPKGYELNAEGLPTFRYVVYGANVTDATAAMSDGHGFQRKVTIDNPGKDFVLRLAEGQSIEELSKGLYLIDDQSYYLRIDDAQGQKPFVRDIDGKKELLVPAANSITYSVLF